MSSTKPTWLALCIIVSSGLSACSNLVSVDRRKIPDELYEVPKHPDAGMKDSGMTAPMDEDAGDTGEDAGR